MSKKITTDDMLKAYLDGLERKTPRPDTIMNCECGHSAKLIMFNVKKFSHDEHPLSIRKGNKYHCPKCNRVVHSEVTLIS